MEPETEALGSAPAARHSSAQGRSMREQAAWRLRRISVASECRLGIGKV